MVVVRKETKRGQNLIARAKRNDGVFLRDCYKNFSDSKQSAWEWCWNKCQTEDGWCFHICSHNTNCFA